MNINSYARQIFALAMCLVLAGCSQSTKSVGGGQQALSSSRWTPLFNGEDLTGWESLGGAKWTVEDGLLVGTQGENFAHGDLFTVDSYSDFVLLVDYKVEWPANTGVWFRYQSPKQAYQADILEYPNPIAYSGTLYCPGKMFLAINSDPSIVDRDGWNTMKIRAHCDRLQVWLNDRETADVHDPGSADGRIGFQIHAGEQFAPMKILVREAKIRLPD